MVITWLARATPVAIFHPPANGLRKINNPQPLDVVERDVGEIEGTSIHDVIVTSLFADHISVDHALAAASPCCAHSGNSGRIIHRRHSHQGQHRFGHGR